MQFWYFVLQTLGKLICIPIINFFLILEVSGRENAEIIEGPLIITPNHKSYLDHFLIGAALPFNFKLFPIRAMADIVQMNRSLVGLGIRILGGFAAKTKGRNLNELFDVPEKILKNKGVVLLYPEGSMFKDAKIHKLKSGAAELALRTSANILPAAISGLDCFSLNDLPGLIFARRKIKISFGEAFSADRRYNRKELTKKIENEIRALYDPSYN